MSRHLPVGAAILFLSISPLAASNASAQNPDKLLEKAAGDASPSGTEPDPIVAPQVPVESNPSGLAGERSRSLMPLYVSTAALQVLDIHSTLQVLRAGGGEGNPVLGGLAGNEGAFIAAKAAIAAGSLYAASRIAKRNRVGAVIALLGINGAYAFVIAHNYRLAHQMR